MKKKESIDWEMFAAWIGIVIGMFAAITLSGHGLVPTE